MSENSSGSTSATSSSSTRSSAAPSNSDSVNSIDSETADQADTDSNPFKPMPAASKNPSSEPTKTQASTFMITAAVAAAVVSSVVRVVVYESPWTSTAFEVIIGLVLAIAISSIPLPQQRNWRRKYWVTLRAILYLLSLIAIVLSLVHSYVLITVYAPFVVVPFLTVYIIERWRRRRRSGD